MANTTAASHARAAPLILLYVSCVLLTWCAPLPHAQGVSLAASKSGVTPPIKAAGGLPTVWLYTSVACDYDGAVLLPHFLEHYIHGFGIDARRLLVVVNHNPDNPDKEQVARGKANLERVKDVLASYGAPSPKMWMSQYSSEELYQYRLELMEQTGPNDWIVHADSDEFHDFRGLSEMRARAKSDSLPLAAYFASLMKRGINNVGGEYLDRVAEGGELAALRSSPGIQQQYPLKCGVIRELVASRNVKAMAYMGMFRSDRGNHQVVRPVKARAYYGPSSQNEKGGRGVYGQADYYKLTPYSKYPKRYAYNCQRGDVEVRYPLPDGMGSCGDKAHPEGKSFGASNGLVPKGLPRDEATGARVHHFKWHDRVKNSISDRLKFYSSERFTGGQGTPRYDWYKDSQKLMDNVVKTGRIDTVKAQCKY